MPVRRIRASSYLLLVLSNIILRDLGGRSFLVPRLAFKPVADELLIKARFGLTDFVFIGRPEAGAVRCQDFVHQNDGAVFIQTEFEFGVGDDDALSSRVFGGLLIKGESVVSNLGSDVFAVLFDDFFVSDVFVVMTGFSLAGRSEDRFGQFFALL